MEERHAELRRMFFGHRNRILGHYSGRDTTLENNDARAAADSRPFHVMRTVLAGAGISGGCREEGVRDQESACGQEEATHCASLRGNACVRA